MDALCGILVVLFGVLGYALLFVVLARVDRISTRVGVLERDVRSTWLSYVAARARVAAPDPETPVDRSHLPFDIEFPARPIIEPESQVAAEVLEVPDAPPEATDVRAIDWEMFAGGRFLNVVGAIVLIIGVGLLMKYALDQQWIGALPRVLAGTMLGLAAIAIGAVTNAKQKAVGRAWFSDGLLGMGLGVLYVCGFTSFEGYHIVSFSFAFTFMASVTSLAFALARKYDSLPMALIGWAGGFITPFAMGFENVEEAGLAAYIVILDIGLCGLAIARRKWFGLQPLALVGSYILAIAWFANHGYGRSNTVSALSIVGIWLVFYAAGVTSALRERPAEDPRAATSRLLVDIFNAAAMWFLLGYVIPGQNAFARVDTCIAIAYGAAYVLVARERSSRVALRAQYLFGAATFLGAAIVACEPRMDICVIFEILALLCGAVTANFRSTSITFVREAALLSYGFTAKAVLAFFEIPNAMTFGGTFLITGIGSRDVALVLLMVVGCVLDRCTRRAFLAASSGLVLRQIMIAAVLALEGLHLTGYSLSGALVVTGIAISLAHFALRRFGKEYAPGLEAAYASCAVICCAALAYFVSPSAFVASVGAFDSNFGNRDLVLALFLIATFVLDRGWRGDARAQALCFVLRMSTLASATTLVFMHTTGLGRVTAFACIAMFVLGIDRTMRSSNASYAPKNELVLTASGLLGFAWLLLFTCADRFTYTGIDGQIGFGKVDSSLVVVAVSSVVLARTLRACIPSAAQIVLRQSIVLLCAIATLIHTTDLVMWAAFAVEAYALTTIGTRRFLRDFEIAGLLMLAVSVTGALCNPSSWQAENLATFATFQDARAYAFFVMSAVGLLMGNGLFRSSLLEPFVGRTVRLVGVVLAIFG